MLALGTVLGGVGCSDPVPPASKAGLRLHVFGSLACPSGALTKSVGNPGPTAPNKGATIFDGEQGVKTSCRVSGGPDFAVSGHVEAPGLSFDVEDGVINANGTGTARITFYIPEAATSLSSSSCTLTAIQGAEGPQVIPGAVWARFDCDDASAPPAVSCDADGEFVFENCSQ
ncbi:MAG TPA: hypothetical protein VKY73_18955 [Polyangiaceae bacterium]|nr:hypothetical protein [Polyangiaceae bacterium]